LTCRGCKKQDPGVFIAEKKETGTNGVKAHTDKNQVHSVLNHSHRIDPNGSTLDPMVENAREPEPDWFL
jgi:hypothetical protein